MDVIEIPVPKEFEPFKHDFRYFVESMVRKLHINRHKGFAENDSLESLMEIMRQEMEELTDARNNGSQSDVFFEAADVANLAFLVALKAWQMRKIDFHSPHVDSANPVLNRN